MKRRLRTLRLSLELLLGRRLVLFGVIDLLILGMGFLEMLLSTGEAESMYTMVVLLPFLVLGLPALSGLVMLERRAGCLDLALSAPDAEGYFLRRVGAVCLVMAVQGWLVMLVSWLFATQRFPLLVVVSQIAAVSLCLGAAALFWAVRLKTAGGVWLASMGTIVLLKDWFFFNPVPSRHWAEFGPLLLGAEESIPWLISLAVLATATIILYLYTRRRLRRPETLIA